MSEDRNSDGKIRVNPSYVAAQLTRALKTAEEHSDQATRSRAEGKVGKWLDVLNGILSGGLRIGSRLPVDGAPIWATLEVVKGGFATGQMLAAGEILEHERQLAAKLEIEPGLSIRAALNAYFVSEQGLSELEAMLASGCYRVELPEEGALLTVCWLLKNGDQEHGRELIQEIAPYFETMRFYPIPASQSLELGPLVQLRTITETIGALQTIRPREQVEAQREAITIWLPLYDRVVSLFAETVESGWPCQKYPDGWRERATALLDEYSRAKYQHTRCKSHLKKKDNFARVRHYLQLCLKDPAALTGRDVGCIKSMLARVDSKRGLPGTERCEKLRRWQATIAARPSKSQFAQILISRLSPLQDKRSIASADAILYSVQAEESEKFKVPMGALLPDCFEKKLNCSVLMKLSDLISFGLVSSSEKLASMIPAISAYVKSESFEDPQLQCLYSSVYQSFSRRRSLLLLDLAKQAQLKELPWMAAIDSYQRPAQSRGAARRALVHVCEIAIGSFPAQILPNKLIRQLHSLSTSAGLAIPLVEELAADIFMDKFSAKFFQSAVISAEFMHGRLYDHYYDISREKLTENEFARICLRRAGQEQQTGYSVARNGMVIEQEQILTTHNLAVLFKELELAPLLQSRLDLIVRGIFQWICRVQQTRYNWKGELKMLKNSAYAWRQMIFFLSLMDENAVAEFLTFADEHLSKQRVDFSSRFAPVLQGLHDAHRGISPSYRFVGWTVGRHKLSASGAEATCDSGD